MDVASLIEKKKNPRIPDIAPGDTVKVSARIVEGGKERIQVFQGVVIKIKGGGNGASFTVRHVAYGIGVERTFPYLSPLVEKVEIVRQGKVRRSRLYYLRGLSGKESRRKIKRVERKSRPVAEDLLEAEPEEELRPEDVLPAEAEMVEGKTPEAEVEEAPVAGVAEPETAAVEAPEAVADKPESEEKNVPVAEEEASPIEEAVAEPPVMEQEETGGEESDKDSA